VTAARVGPPPVFAPGVFSVADAHPLYDPDDPEAVACYAGAIHTLRTAGVPFLVGGAYAFARFTGIVRHTKDCDLFLKEADLPRALDALRAAGFRTEITYTHWLAKAFKEHYFVDLIFCSGNGQVPVDDGWFAHAVDAVVFGEPVKLCPAEESLWSKAFIMERNRFDGADVNHLILAYGEQMNWPRLVARFGDHWRVLYAHLILFGFAYPAEREKVPAWVMWEMAARMSRDVQARPPDDRVCQGVLLAAAQYLPDVERWGYEDARLEPHGTMTPEQVDEWTDGVITGR
jgi:hypothetical protein